MNFELVELGTKGLHHFRGGRDIALASHRGQWASQGAVKIADAGFFGRDTENGIFDDMNLRVGFAEPFSQFRQMPYLQAFVINDDEEWRAIEASQVFFRQVLFLWT